MILTLEALESAIERRTTGRLVLAHGCWDLLHIGHIRHLQEARSLGDVLVVTVTGDHFIAKGPGRPAFNELIRAEAVAALRCVDLVAINDYPNAVNVIRLLRPNVYVKGPDVRSAPTRNLILERAALEAYGGRLVFTDGQVYHSTELLKRTG